MAKIKVRLLRPLDGNPVGKVMAFGKPDAERLAGTGAVTILGTEKARQARAKKAPTPDNKRAPTPANKSAQ